MSDNVSQAADAAEPGEVAREGVTDKRKGRRSSHKNRAEYSQLRAYSFREKLDQHRISQEHFARIIGRGSTLVHEWSTDRSRIPSWVDLIFELLEVKPSVGDRFVGRRGPTKRPHMPFSALDVE